MDRIIASRAMGKTTRLLELAKRSASKGRPVIFIMPNRVMIKNLAAKYQGIEFMSFREFIEARGRNFDDVDIFIDEIEGCLISVMPWGSYPTAYSYTIGD